MRLTGTAADTGVTETDDSAAVPEMSSAETHQAFGRSVSRSNEVQLTMSVDDFSHDQLEQFTKVADIEGRSNLTSKQQMYDALEEEAPHLIQPFHQVSEVEVGDTVSMNHLKSDLTVTSIADYDGDEVTLKTGDETETQSADTTSRTEVVMETSRGGRHKLVAEKGDVFGKNGDDPHLERWRAGDREWMNNSTDPMYFNVLTDDDDEEDSDD